MKSSVPITKKTKRLFPECPDFTGMTEDEVCDAVLIYTLAIATLYFCG
jgi:hypothetical protein